MSSLVSPDGKRTTFTFDNAGQKTVTELANGTRESITYNQVGSIQRVANIRSDSATIFATFAPRVEPSQKQSRVFPAKERSCTR